VFLLLINSNNLFGDALKTFGHLIECSLLGQFDILLQFLEFMSDLCDETVLMSCDSGDDCLLKTTAFEFVI